jgi:alpha-galactosidase
VSYVLQSPSLELAWRPNSGSFSLESPGRRLDAAPSVVFLRKRRKYQLDAKDLAAGRVSRQEIEDVHGTAQELQVHYQEAAGLSLTMQMRLYQSRPFALFRLSAVNVGPERVRVRRLAIRTRPNGLETRGDPTGVYVNGWQSWSPSGFILRDQRQYRVPFPIRWLQGPMIHNGRSPRTLKRNRYWSEMVGAVVTPEEALVGGATTLADQFVQMSVDLRSGHEVVQLQAQLDDLPLGVGAACQSEWFYLEWVPLPNRDPFAQYAYAVIRQMDVSSMRTVPTGWCSWYIHGNRVSEADVMENLASAALLADYVPLDVIQIDDGYQEAWGDWAERNDRFPHPMKWLADRIAGSDFTPGLWLAPLVVRSKSDLAREHPDWILKDGGGRPVSAGLVSNFLGHVLDPTHPGVQRHVQDLIHMVVDAWGYRYLKLDFLYAGALPGRHHNPQMTRAQGFHRLMALIREAAGPEVFLLGCGAPLGPSVGLVDAMRVGPDTAPSWSPGFSVVDFLLRKNEALPSLRNSLRNTASRAWMHNRWWLNDPDTLLMRDKQTDLTEHEVRAQVTLLGLSGGALMLSDDLDDLSPARRAMAALLFPPLLEGIDTVDLFSRSMPETVIAPMARRWGRWRLLGLFNWQDEPVERTLPEVMPFDERKAYHIVDFWDHRYFRMKAGSRRPVLHLDPHGVVLLGIRTVAPDPHLVFTSFHLSQGGEVTDIQLGDAEIRLFLKLDRLADGEVWLALPSRPTSITLNDQPLDDVSRAVGSGVWSIAFRFNRTAELRVSWADV